MVSIGYDDLLSKRDKWGLMLTLGIPGCDTGESIDKGDK